VFTKRTRTPVDNINVKKNITMEINDELLDILTERVLKAIEATVDRAIGDKDLTSSEYAQLWNAYRKALLNELR
jgi:hypothetical protein